ncbi:MAG: hypothetical protein JO265_06330 [Acidimicrobiia bacterium]|nr:hypothetical protein [Acidimicrobiia bacterium]
MRSAEDVARVIEFSTSGLNPYEIARVSGVPRETVRRWLAAGAEEVLADRAGNARDLHRCALAEAAPPGPYAYLLGQYLGDGHITRHPRDVYRLVISCCDDYPGIIEECTSAMRAVMPTNTVGYRSRPGVVAVSSYSKHWPCLFPQHGPGHKHERRIVLTPWQEGAVQVHAREFIRGLIHSDGCRATNRVRGQGRWYAYPRYFFKNESADIRMLFGWACDLVGVEWRYNRYNSISIARRESVALLDLFVGPKR